MSENRTESPTSGVPQAILDKVTKTREIVGHTVRQVDKTGSLLYLIDNNERQGIIRNAEIPESSMAVWEFVHSYAHTLFPEETAQKLFNVWEKPQVVPILDRKGGDRVYYRNGKASAYSEMIGFDTLRLAELWQLQDVFREYTVQQHGFLRAARWWGATSYWFTKDVVEAIPKLGNQGELMQLLEEYWAEFTRLNADRIGRNDLLRMKELRRQDMDSDDAYQSSIKLVETGHAIAAYLRQKLQEVEANPNTQLEWRGKPAKELLLFLLHLHQTSAQQMVLWWLGVAHGHLHFYNSVSRVPEDVSTAPSPLETRVIDFDDSRVSVSKLAGNDELYQVVDSKKVREKIRDSQVNINLRLQFIMYLPMQNWDEGVFQLLDEHADKPLVGQIARLISIRASKDVTTPELFNQFSNFIYRHERNTLKPEGFPAFYLTISLMKNGAPQVEGSALEVLQKYIQGGLEAIDLPSLDDEGQLLLLSAIFYNNPDGRYEGEMLSRTEFEWAFKLLDKPGLSAAHAEELIEGVLDDYYEKLVATIFDEAAGGNEQSLELAKKLLRFVYARTGDYKVNVIQNHLVSKLYNIDKIQFALSLIDFSAIPKEQALVAYKSMRKAFHDNYNYSGDDQQKRKAVLGDLDRRAQQSRGRMFVWSQRVRDALQRDKG